MRVRLLALCAALAVTTMLAVTPAFAAETGGAASQQSPGALVAPVQSGIGDYWSDGGCGCGMGGFAGTMPSGGFGYPGWFAGPWWAGMPLGAISASTGFTWPWAPWYWTPQWWTLAALSH